MREIPSIQQAPQEQAESNIHYGYNAFRPIFIGDLNADKRIQPPESPYFREIPAREVIPFTNISVPLPKSDDGTLMMQAAQQGIDPMAPQDSHARLTNDPTVVFKPKSAKVCAEQLLDSYEDWGYTVLYPLTGYSERDAFLVMQAITPFSYKLSDLADVVSDEVALQRIEATETYSVPEPYPTDEDNAVSIEIEPLSPQLQAVAKQVLPIIQGAVQMALRKAEEIEADTRQKMESFFSGNDRGKRAADPLDKYVFAELDKAIPTRIGSEKKQDDPIARLTELMINDRLNGQTETAQKQAQLDELIRKAQEQLEKLQSITEKPKGKAKTPEE